MSKPRHAGRSLRRLRLGLLAFLGVALVLSSLATGAAGDLDPSFGNGGKVVTDLGANERALATAIQSDGKIVVAGQDIDGRAYRDFLVVRYGADGSLDPSFGAGGHVRTDFEGSDWAEGVLIQPDGKIVAAGYAGGRFGVARYNADGSLDGSFGEGGKVRTAVGPGGASSAAAVALQADGKIVVAGEASITSDDSDFALVRYNPDGGLDGGFGAGGKVVTAFTPALDFAFGVAVDADGKITAGGVAGRTSPSFGDAALARYNPDGSLDTSFGAMGKVTAPDSGFVQGFALQPDGKIVLSGHALIRYMRNGSIDTGFGADGRLALTNVVARAVAVQADGKIVAAGETFGPNYDFAVLRFKPNGDPDESFAAGAGMTTTDIGSSSYDFAWSVNFQSDGKIVVAGETGRAFFDRLDFAVVRFLNPAPPPAAKCVVPNVRGKTLAAARRMLAKRRCAVGKVKRKASARVKRGRVISQGRRPGARLPNRSKVNLVISRGRQ
jgi:uncharacterized delta-60 repeat protein